MAVGLYISVPFCRSKCSYCNFASDVFSRQRMQAYVDRLCQDLTMAEQLAAAAGASFDSVVDTVYLGGGTPSILTAQQLEQVFRCVRQEFALESNAEITVECAPGTLDEPIVDCLINSGVNRVSLGTQSFVDQEARAVGRLHTREVALNDIARLRSADVDNINLDLIAGLPHQSRESWEQSLSIAIGTGAPHISVYMLEVDDDSRLGREVLAGGTRYHAHSVPDEELTVNLYSRAGERLNNAGIAQYEISNFAKSGFESRHNVKYWTRQPYMGFGLDAHSMLPSATAGLDAVRLAMPDSLEAFLAPRDAAAKSLLQSRGILSTPIGVQQAWEETFFLGLRLNRGVDLVEVDERFGSQRLAESRPIIRELQNLGLAEVDGEIVRLTSRGRLLSNEVFEMFMAGSANQEAEIEGAHAKPGDLVSISHTML